MNMPIKCPVCGDPLLTTFGIYLENKHKSMWKSCGRRLGHNIEFFFKDENDTYVTHVTIFTGKLRIIWQLLARELVIKNDTMEQKLPYFDPDLSDYRKLINKMKIYMIFS